MTHDPTTTDPSAILKGRIIKTKMTFVVALVNAEMARDMLLHNREPEKNKKATNRKVSDRIVIKYAQQMLAGRWYVNPQPIILSEFEKGVTVSELNDGQHRLRAVILADQTMPGIGVPLTFCFNAPPEAWWVVDQNKARLPGDWLSMYGEANATKLSNAVRVLYALECMQPFKSISLWRAVQLPPQVQQEFLDKHADLRYCLDEVLKMKSQIIPQIGAALYYLMRAQYGNWKAQEFFTGLASGANLDTDDPRLKVREFLSIQRVARYKWDGFEQLGLLISAVNAWLLGIDSFKAKGAFTKTQAKFPELVGPDKLPKTLLTPGNTGDLPMG